MDSLSLATSCPLSIQSFLWLRHTRADLCVHLLTCRVIPHGIALHFKLAVGDQGEPQNYEDVRFTYKPQINASRDAELIDLLPDYFTEEITFSRPQVAKFHARVSRSLAERADTSII